MTLRGYITLGELDGCDCGGSCGCGGVLSAWGLAGLGALDAKAQGAIASSGQAGRIVQSGGGAIYVPGTADCAASGVSGAAKGLQLTGSAGSLALTGAVQTGLLTAGAATFGISVAIAGIVGIFSTIFQHHAQAVKKEQSVLCSAVPAANNYLDVIDQAVATGQASAAKALQALDSLNSDFHGVVSSIYKSCNAACVMQMCLDAALATQRARYTALAQQQSAAAAGAIPVATSPVLMPSPVSTTNPSVVPGGAQASGPGATQIVSSGSTLMLPAKTNAQPSTLPSWWPLAALALFGIFAYEAL